jgi:predicted transcriptional regulator
MKLHPTIVDLIRDIEVFIARHEMTPTDFGLLSIGDPNLYRHLKNGRNPRFPTLDRIRSFMRKYEERAA